MEDLKRTLDNAVDCIINNIDCCSVCAYLKECQAWPEDIPDDVEPCRHRRERGDDGCREGIIKYFKAKAQETSRSEERKKTVQVDLNDIELFYICQILESAIMQFQREGETVEYDKRFLERLQGIYKDNFGEKKQ